MIPFLKTILANVAAAACVGAALTALSANAQTVDADAARDVLRNEIRAFLLEEPEIITEALRVLEQRRLEASLSQLDALIDSGERVLDTGTDETSITLIEMTDYNCPYCRRAQPEIAAFLAANPDVRHVVKALPYIGADTAERAVLAAKVVGGAEPSEALHRALMASSARWSDSSIMDAAEGLGLDRAALGAAMGSAEVEAQMGRTVQVARALQIDGTPAFILEGEVLGGLRTADELGGMAAAVRAARQ